MIAGFLTLNSFCQEYIEFKPSDNTDVKCNVLTSENTIVEFEVTLPGIFSNEVDSFSRVEVNGHTRMKTTGSPELPVLSFLVAIPVCNDVNVTVELLDSIRIDNINIYPAPEIVEDSTEAGSKYLREEFYYDETVYGNNSFFPGILAETVNKGAVREQHCVRIFLYPIQFNPIMQQITAYSKMKVGLTFTNPSDLVNENVGIFNEMVGNTMVNYVSNGLNASVSCGAGQGTHTDDYWVTSIDPPNYCIEDPCDYLIIAPEEFYTNTDAREAINSLAMHRESFNGFDVKIITTSVIADDMPQGYELFEQIKMLIQNTYNDGIANNTYDGKLAYVNLFSDVNLESGNPGAIPTFSEGYDIFYTQLTIPPEQTEPDPYPDIMIGRCSADNAEQVANVAYKTINFNPMNMPGNNNMLTALGNDGQYFHLYSNVLENMDNILQDSYNKKFMAPNEYENSSYYKPEWGYVPYASNGISFAWQTGLMFINYMGHGGSLGWHIPSWASPFRYDDLNMSSHEGKLPLMLSTACWTGSFQNTDQEDCMGERFLCYDENMGGIGFYGATEPTSPYSFHLCEYYYDAMFNNYSYVLGENLMEVKVDQYDDAWFTYDDITINWCEDYNLLGDPALNILYENIETMLPDLTIKDYEITFSSEIINKGDIATITANIRNIMNVDIENSFNVECYCINLSTSESVLLGSNQINGMVDVQHVLSEFIWNTDYFETGIYGIQIVIDPEDNVLEFDELNNLGSKDRNIYSYNHNHFISSNISSNAKVISFNFDDEQVGEEIIFGQAIFTSGGELISPAAASSKSNTSIANLENNNNYQFIQFQQGSSFTPHYIKSFGDPSWQYPIFGSSYSHAICDLNSDGYEEVICHILIDDELYKLTCLNHNGTLRWEFDDFADPPPELFLEPILGNFNNQNNSIIIMTNGGTLYNIKETSNAEPEIDYSYSIPDCISVLTSPVASDINKDGDVEIIFIYSKSSHGVERILANYNASDFSENHSLVLDYQSYINPIISDLNNDGESEIIVGEINGGLYIYNMELELLSHILDNNIKDFELVAGDINNDLNNDIICQDKINDDYFIRAFDIDGNETFNAFLYDQHWSRWLSDINLDGKINLVCSRFQNMYVVNFPEAGNSIGWPGQRGNSRNTGVLEQPAFFGEPSETVYWMNTISLSPDVENIIPEGSTVIVKPGTKIKAHANSSLIVHGILIAEGTEKHIITFTADIGGAPKGYWQGITVSNHSTISMKNCELKDAEIGVLFEDNCTVTFENNHLENNIEAIGAETSRPTLKENIIIENTIGIGCYDNAAPILTDLKFEQQFKNGIIDNHTGILIEKSNIYLDNGHNDIYNVPFEGYYIQLIFEPGPSYIKARNNYWGTTDIEEIFQHLSPPQSFIIEPILTTPQSSYIPPEGQETEMLKSANNSMEAGEYSAAENIFKSIISQYPETPEAYLSVSGLFECYSYSSGNWNNLENYYNELYNDSTITIEFQKLFFSYMNLCKRAAGDFSGAIANYESIILNNPTYNDSVFAVIDIGNTYEEAGNYKSTLGQLSYLVPVSRAKHVEKTVDLLLSLHPDDDKVKNQPENDFIISDIIPNPFRNETAIFFEVPYSCSIRLNVYDVTGRIIKSNDLGNISQGNHNYILQMPQAAPGVYYVALEANGKQVGVRKVVVN